MPVVAGWSRTVNRRNKMTLPTNDDFAIRELSVEELEAIAAGWPHWVHSAVHAVEHAIGSVVHWIESGPRYPNPFPNPRSPDPYPGGL